MSMLILSHVRPFGTPWTVARQAPLSMESSRQEYWNGLPFPPPGDLPDPGIELAFPAFPALQVDFFFFLPLSHGESPCHQVFAPSESARGKSVSHLFQLLSIPWLVATSF